MSNIPRRLVLVICLALQLFWFTQVAVLKTGKAQIRMDDLLMNTKSFAEQIESPQVLNASTSRIDFTSMAKTRIEKVSGLLPISFERNEGQANSGVDFLSRGAGYGLFFKIAKILTSTQSTGPKIAFGSNRDGGNHEIYLMDIDGSNQIRITNNAAYDDQPKWSPDGSKIAFMSNRDGNFEIYSMNSDGTSQTRLTNNSAGDGFPVWSPDGTKIALVSGDLSNPSTFDIYVMNADGSNRTRLTLDALVDGVPSWSPDGSKLLFMSGPSSIFDPNSFEIFVMDANGTNRMRLTNNSVVDGQASFSPDGTKILFASGDALHPEGIEIFVMNPNGTGRTQLTNNSVTDGFPAWAAQGTKVILASGSINDEASVELFIMNADGSNRLRLTNNSALDWFADSQPAIPGATTVQFSASNYIVSEGSGRIDVSVTRSGDTSGTSTVDYITTDTDNFTVGCSQPSGGNAFGRCDFATSVDTLTFGPSETSKTLSIPIINDAIAEGSETFGVTLSNTAGTTLGSPATATITITDNDAVTGPNPIFTTAFFVRQHYLDFLSREPESNEPWSAILNGCSDVNNNPACDRLTVSGAIFGSPEFSLKGLYVYRFYKLAFNRLPLYSEIVVDMRAVTGATPPETFQKKASFTNNFVLRTEFVNLYNAQTNTQYVNTLMGRYSLTSIRTPDPAAPDGSTKVTLTTADLINRLNGVGGTLTRAQVLRAIADSEEVGTAEANQGFVAMQYYGYLRRTPDTPGFNSWINHLNANPTDFRTMVNGFMNSDEYRLRFGPQN